MRRYEVTVFDRTLKHCVGWLKGCRSIATQHEKLALNFAAMVPPSCANTSGRSGRQTGVRRLKTEAVLDEEP